MSDKASLRLGRRSAEILAELRRELAGGGFPPGCRLSGELELCARFGVSRNTIRKAVACLVEDGQVVVRKGTGMFVPTPAQAACANTVAVMGFFSGAELADLQRAALAAGALLCVYSQVESQWQPALERQFLERLRAERPRGLVAFLSPLAPRNDDLTAALVADGLRVVHMDYFQDRLPKEGFMLCDYVQAGRQAGVELLLGGYDQVRVVRSTSAPFEELFERGVMAALNEHGTGFDPARQRLDWRAAGDGAGNREEKVARLAAELRASPGTVGFACSCSGVALAVQAAAQAAGRRLPAELGIIVLGLNVSEATVVPELDLLVYDRHQAYQEALATVLAPEWHCPQVLQQPTLRRRGSVRHRPLS